MANYGRIYLAKMLQRAAESLYLPEASPQQILEAAQKYWPNATSICYFQPVFYWDEDAEIRTWQEFSVKAK